MKVATEFASDSANRLAVWKSVMEVKMFLNEMKFVMVKTNSFGNIRKLNELGAEGWRFHSMEPFYQEDRMRFQHIMRQMIVCLKKSPGRACRYYVKHIKGHSKSPNSFRAEDLTDKCDDLRRCGFEFQGFHHIVKFSFSPKRLQDRAMLGYFCVWSLDIDGESILKTNERIASVAKKASEDPEFKTFPKGRENEDASHVKLIELIEKINELEALELKRQMGKDWDDGLLNVKPDPEAVAKLVSWSPDTASFVEDVIWFSTGNLIASSMGD